MTIDMRGRRLLNVVAVAVPLALLVIGVLAWRAGGPQPVADNVVPIGLPEAAR